MEEIKDKETPMSESTSHSPVKDREPPAPVDLGYDKGHVDGYAVGVVDGREAGMREASEAAAAEHAKALEAAEARHEKTLEALASRHDKALKQLRSVRADAAEAHSEVEVEADTARFAAVQEILTILDARINHGHADGRLAVMDARDLIAAAFEDV